MKNIQKRDSCYICIKYCAVIWLMLICSACNPLRYAAAWHFYEGAGDKRLPGSAVAYLMLDCKYPFEARREGGATFELVRIKNNSIDISIKRGSRNGWDNNVIALLPGEHTLIFAVTNYVVSNYSIKPGSISGWKESWWYTKAENEIIKTIEVVKGKKYLAMPTLSGKDVSIKLIEENQ